MQPSAILLALTALVAGAQAPAVPLPTPKLDRSAKPGVGDLLVAPQRLILESGVRSGELLLQNTGSRTATYRVSFIQMAMAEDGTLREITEKTPGGKYADEIVRYSPRQVTLEPGATQTLRVTVRPPASLATGEYRSHLVFRAVPEAEPRDAKPEEAQGISVRLTPIYGVAIPIVVRHGDTSASVRWESANLLNSPSLAAEAVLARTGNQTAYGNLVAVFTPAGGGEPVIAARMTMVGIYDGLARRRFHLPLNLPGGPSQKGSLLITFQHPDTATLLAETRLEIR